MRPTRTRVSIMKSITTLAVALFALALTSCGGGNKEQQEPAPVKVKPETTAIKGALAGCFEVVDKEYTLKDAGFGNNKKITIEVKRTDAEIPYSTDDIDSFGNKYHATTSMLAGFGIELLDKDGNVLMSKAPSESTADEKNVSMALRSSAGETTTFEIWLSDYEGTPVSFRITSDLQKNEKEESVSEETADAEEEKTTSSEDDDKAVENAKQAVRVASSILGAGKEAADILDALY